MRSPSAGLASDTHGKPYAMVVEPRKFNSWTNFRRSKRSQA